jgi:hypothetical protein
MTASGRRFRGGEILITYGVATLRTEIIAAALPEVSKLNNWTAERFERRA